MSKGWIKLHRSIADHPRFQDQKWLIVWIKCLTLATHKPYSVVFAGKVIELQKGQFITSRKSLSEKTGVSESTVERILTTLENEQQIGQQSSSVSRLITVTNWIEYQDGEQEDEQQTDSGRTAGGQRADTNKNEKKIENEKEVGDGAAPPRASRFAHPTPQEVSDYCRERGTGIDPEKFYAYYESNGWKVGRNPMRSWKAAVTTWEKTNGSQNGSGRREGNSSAERNGRKLQEQLGKIAGAARVGTGGGPQVLHLVPPRDTGILDDGR